MKFETKKTSKIEDHISERNDELYKLNDLDAYLDELLMPFVTNNVRQIHPYFKPNSIIGKWFHKHGKILHYHTVTVQEPTSIETVFKIEIKDKDEVKINNK